MTPAQLAAIHAKSFTEPHLWSAQAFSDLLENDAVFLCTCKHGFALGRVAGPEVELLTIAVDPTCQRQGLALGLMQAFETCAKDKGAQDAFLEVAETNHPAIGLYRRIGFIEAGHRKNYYASPKGTRITAIVMKKTL